MGTATITSWVERDVVSLHGFDPDVKTLPALDSLAYEGSGQRRKHRALLTMARTGILKGYKPAPASSASDPRL